LNLIEKVWTPELRSKADAIVVRYETKRASVLEVLRLIMEEKGHITLDDERATAEYLEIPEIDVREVMTFYTLFYDKPRTKLRLNVCRTLSCHLAGADIILQHLTDKLGLKDGETSNAGQCSFRSVECLGACEIAPMMQINDDEFAGQLTVEKIDEILNRNLNGKK
jgi:NADH:ubiquinone oxidoreductase subunit E